mmetsp:Transcript_66395/g.187667  ORF Transcript_66395/g.187667 Transcript_66395/m.187667 type:complete len:278 (-) Transcript_66395:120-953(-)
MDSTGFSILLVTLAQFVSSLDSLPDQGIAEVMLELWGPLHVQHPAVDPSLRVKIVNLRLEKFHEPMMTLENAPWGFGRRQKPLRCQVRLNHDECGSRRVHGFWWELQCLIAELHDVELHGAPAPVVGCQLRQVLALSVVPDAVPHEIEIKDGEHRVLLGQEPEQLEDLVFGGMADFLVPLDRHAAKRVADGHRKDSRRACCDPAHAAIPAQARHARSQVAHLGVAFVCQGGGFLKQSVKVGDTSGLQRLRPQLQGLRELGRLLLVPEPVTRHAATLV